MAKAKPDTLPNCPFCGGKLNHMKVSAGFRVTRKDHCLFCDNEKCEFAGPWKPTRAAAVDVVRSIRVRKEPSK